MLNTTEIEQLADELEARHFRHLRIAGLPRATHEDCECPDFRAAAALRSLVEQVEVHDEARRNWSNTVSALEAQVESAELTLLSVADRAHPEALKSIYALRQKHDLRTKAGWEAVAHLNGDRLLVAVTRKRVAEARLKAVEPFLQHDLYCKTRSSNYVTALDVPPPDERPCTCGLTAALSAEDARHE